MEVGKAPPTGQGVVGKEPGKAVVAPAEPKVERAAKPPSAAAEYRGRSMRKAVEPEAPKAEKVYCQSAVSEVKPRWTAPSDYG